MPYRNWLPALRFPRVQQRPDTSYDVRPIDDCTGSGLNFTIVIMDKMVLDNLSKLKKAAAHIHKLWGNKVTETVTGAKPERGIVPQFKPVWAKGDHEKL